jgi:hypothetical protein
VNWKPIGRGVQCKTCSSLTVVHSDDLGRTKDWCPPCSAILAEAEAAALLLAAPASRTPQGEHQRRRARLKKRAPRRCPNIQCEGTGFMPKRRGRPSLNGCDPCRRAAGELVFA